MKRTLVWMNDQARQQGGAETYIRNTVKALRVQHPEWEHHLLYSPGQTELAFLELFDSAWVIPDTPQMHKRLKALQPDWIYVHQLPHNIQWERFFALCQEHPWKTLRFLHDHKLFCLREHKYTALNQSTCTRTTGLHCYACPGFIQRSQQQWQFKSLKVLQHQQRLHRHFDALVVGSPYMANEAISHGLDAEKIHVLPLYHQRQASSPEAAPTVPVPKSDSEPFRFLFVGQLLQGKGLDLLFKAIKKALDDSTPSDTLNFEVDILGSGAQEMKLRQQVEQAGLTSRVHFHGWVQNKVPYWQQAHALVLPSRSPETFGLVGLEAMAYGIPVIASDVGGISSWLTPNTPKANGDLFASGDVRALSQLLTAYVKNPKTVAQKGMNAYATWQKHFQGEHHLQALSQLFQTLAPQGEPCNKIAHYQTFLTAVGKAY
jgi:glycosyltransferase involved in cell wall biosynthesis